MLDPSNGGIPAEGISRSDFLKVAGAAGLVVTASGATLSLVGGTARAQGDPDDQEGEFGPVFVEPVIYYPEYYLRDYPNGPNRTKTTAECIPPPKRPEQNRRFCKPAAGSNALLPDGRFLFWSAIEGGEDTEKFAVDTDKATEDSQSRVITINYNNNEKSEFLKPKRNTGVSRPEVASELIPGVTIDDDRGGNDGDMFCSSQCHLPGGSVLVVGGTNWYTEGVKGAGVVELEGNSRSRFFDPKVNNWFLTGDMNLGRWYPSLIPTADGTPYVFGGVHKLEKPIYLPPREPGEPQGFDSGQNVREVEKLDMKTGKWKIVGDSDQPNGKARRALPLQARIHLLPNGEVVYNGIGQAFSPNGQDPFQAIWNDVAVFSLKKEEWRELGPAGGTNKVGGSVCEKPTNLGSKLSCFELPLLMEPDEETGDYTTYELVAGGGTHGLILLTSPGSYLANNTSRRCKFTVSGDTVEFESVDTGDMFNFIEAVTELGRPPAEGGFPAGRWFGDAVLLPSGEIFVSGGADRDEVFFPGIEFPIIECEIFDPLDTTDSENGSWRVVGPMQKIRTYHNTNCLLPTGQVIIGGHNPIAFGYVSHDSDVVPGTRNADARDPSFEIYSPAYIDDPNRPEIDVRKNGQKDPLSARTGGKLNIPTKDGASIEDVALLRLSAETHLNEPETRGLVLPVINSDGNSVTARMPKTMEELGGPGFYLAFIRSVDDNGKPLPSEGVYVQVKR